MTIARLPIEDRRHVTAPESARRAGNPEAAGAGAVARAIVTACRRGLRRAAPGPRRQPRRDRTTTTDRSRRSAAHAGTSAAHGAADTVLAEARSSNRPAPRTSRREEAGAASRPSTVGATVRTSAAVQRDRSGAAALIERTRSTPERDRGDPPPAPPRMRLVFSGPSSADMMRPRGAAVSRPRAHRRPGLISSGRALPTATLSAYARGGEAYALLIHDGFQSFDVYSAVETPALA